MISSLVKKAVPLLFALFLGLCVTVKPARANQTNLQILLGTSSFELEITGMGNNTIAVNDRTCSGSTCTFAAGSASGVAGSFSTSGSYLLTSSAQLAFTLTANADGSFSVSQSAPINFLYTSAQGNLTGTLQFVSVSMVPGSTNSATMVGVFTVTGGSLASAVGMPTAPVTVHLSVANSLGLLIGNTNTLTGEVEFPTRISPVPEPGSLLLLGSGLGVLVGFLKRRRGLHGVDA